VDYVLLLSLLFIVVYAVWQRYQHIQSMKVKAALNDFFNRIVPCTIEQRNGEYFIYNDLTKKFVAQGKTPQEVRDNLPDDDKFYLSFDGHREIYEELEDIDVRNKSMVH
jgi:hypothetical protein